MNAVTPFSLTNDSDSLPEFVNGLTWITDSSKMRHHRGVLQVVAYNIQPNRDAQTIKGLGLTRSAYAGKIL